MGDPNAFPSYPAALVMVGLEGVEEVLLAVDGAPCPLLICHCFMACWAKKAICRGWALVPVWAYSGSKGISAVEDEEEELVHLV